MLCEWGVCVCARGPVQPGPTWRGGGLAGVLQAPQLRWQGCRLAGAPACGRGAEAGRGRKPPCLRSRPCQGSAAASSGPVRGLGLRDLLNFATTTKKCLRAAQTVTVSVTNFLEQSDDGPGTCASVPAARSSPQPAPLEPRCGRVCKVGTEVKVPCGAAARVSLGGPPLTDIP